MAVVKLLRCGRLSDRRCMDAWQTHGELVTQATSHRFRMQFYRRQLLVGYPRHGKLALEMEGWKYFEL
jgi:hypothetical protein